MKVIIIAGGPASELPDFSIWPEDTFIGVDAGTIALLDKGIVPSSAVGDFDSVSPEQFARIKRVFPDLQPASSDKDETDTEMALAEAMAYDPEIVIVTGVTGGRLDHYMSALHAIYGFHLKYPGTQFFLINKQNRIRFLEAGSHEILRNSRYRYISFYPFAEEIKGFSLTGFKYEVADETIPFGSTRFISNELEHAGVVSFIEGNCILIESADE
ncbi:thiamine diphosphokinase [Planomicrobium okeanokoites]|uniref:thiamine diphosphokinase n=1 Tax=Planomicrobium okeanokoites TaxID=244 RepID=UPI002491CA92|nr:thiamine diphosphokinase [Planomicrobium okeanokoites]